MEAERVLNDLYKKINETGCEGRLPVAIFRVEKNILTYSGYDPFNISYGKRN